MSSPAMICRVDERRRRLFGNPSWNGIDYVEVDADQLSLAVYFFSGVPQGIDPQHVRIEGGSRITAIRVTNVSVVAGDDTTAPCLRIELDRFGDFSVYTLHLVEIAQDADGASHERPLSGFDPRYAQVDFSFKVDCPSDLDCVPVSSCPSQPAVPPEIDYLTKDYEGFRQLILDRLAVTMPHWRERHVPDIGITVVEILAYVADQLSYYQDAVATEAYLDTARTRISVKRHARLVDYRLHEGCNARAWLSIACSSDATLPADAYFVTRHAAVARLAHGRTLRESELQTLSSHYYEVFEQALAPPATGTALVALHSTLHFYTWDDEECCLPRGATCATLVDPAPAAPVGNEVPPATTVTATPAQVKTTVSKPAQDHGRRLRPGDVLIFEEVLGPITGNTADADPNHRHAVRLTQVRYSSDRLTGTAIIEIEWSPADSLPFALCLSTRLAAPDCRRIGDISVVRGNVILVDHGVSTCESIGTVGCAGRDECCGCDGVVLDTIERPSKFTATLAHAPLTCRESPLSSGAASNALIQDPRKALPQLGLVETLAAPESATAAWAVRADLLECGPDERAFVVEIDDAGTGHLRFGDGRLGRRPAAGSSFKACYRFGEGTAGNVPAEAIAYVVFRTAVVDGAGLEPRNPLPASGGIAPETLAEAKLAAPYAFRRNLLRAITADDYARLAQNNARLQRANARLAWNGSWYEADVAIDPLGSEQLNARLRGAITAELEPFRRVGQDLAVQAARYVPLEITLHVCVRPDYLSAHVEAALALALGNRRLPDGSLGFFHPDRLTFGSDVYASDLIAAAQQIEGVQSVTVTELRRFDVATNAPPPDQIGLAPFEIAQVDNDPNHRERGGLKLCMGGGR
ncbi:MAG TPA: putative baseplate assembly protein [Rudaea sp.]|nr:putative baseplate assembly protein [Rudaea sp.]